MTISIILPYLERGKSHTSTQPPIIEHALLRSRCRSEVAGCDERSWTTKQRNQLFLPLNRSDWYIITRHTYLLGCYISHAKRLKNCPFELQISLQKPDRPSVSVHWGRALFAGWPGPVRTARNKHVLKSDYITQVNLCSCTSSPSIM